MSELKTLIKTRGIIKSQLTRFSKAIDPINEFTSHELKGRFSKLTSIDKEFSKIQLSIELADETQNHELERIAFEVEHQRCADQINKRLGELEDISKYQAPVPPVPTVSVKHFSSLLPNIEIKPYDGNSINWHSFHDTFKSLVHDNTDYPAVHKFHLLKNALVGDLKPLIISFNANEENYNAVWEALIKRCNKPRQIIKSHLEGLLELPTISRDSPNTLRQFTEKAQMHVHALASLNEPVDQWDSFLILLITRKLDKITKRAWDRSLEDDEVPTFNILIKFLDKQARGEEFDSKPFSVQPFKTKKTFIQNGNDSNINRHCWKCLSSEHDIYFCPEFLKLSNNERYDVAKGAKCCINCLKTGHYTTNCKSQNCRICHQNHNTLLHFPKFSNDSFNSRQDLEVSVTHSSENQWTNLAVPECSNNLNTTLTSFCDSEVLLGTARILIQDKFNNFHECRVLLDGCSQTHFITESLANRLQLEKEQIDLPFSGLGQLSTRAQFRVTTTIKSNSNSFTAKVTFVALPKITGDLPSRQVNRNLLQLPNNITLADPEFHKPGNIDVLIGNTLFYQLLSIGQIKLCKTSIILQKTRLGWLVTGQINNSNENTTKMTHIITLDEQLRKFWEMEEMPVKQLLSPEETACEKHFVETVSRDDNGRFIVKLPFNSLKKNIGNSYTVALKRYYSMERKWAVNNELCKNYNNFLIEYADLNHMTDITEVDDQSSGFYLPHHAVIKESSTTTKTRVVFDASAKSSTGYSLNDALMVGPTIQNNIISITTRFRKYRFVLVADIEKMYRQIKVCTEDANFQKILYRQNPHDPVRTYRLDTVTYGTASAPFQSIRCMWWLADKYQHLFPLAAKVLKEDFYVDDMLSGANSLTEIKQLKTQLKELLGLGCFNLRKWVSNEPTLFNEDKESQTSINLCNDPDTQKTLGIQWDIKRDEIGYVVQPLVVNRLVTKRTILSEISQLFDPLGLLGPVIVKAKIIMQELWKAQLNWDESIPQNIHTAWITLRQDLHNLVNFRVPRKICIDDATNIELHGFCDASEKAYGACIYLRTTDQFSNSVVRLVCAKSRVAPIKTISLPRLELCSAELLSTLFISTSTSLKLKFDKTIFWSDSTVALHWIKTPPHSTRLKAFVANRITKIQERTEVSDWFHVASQDNPADVISRGETPTDLISNELWKNGPSWLSKPTSEWKIPDLNHLDEIPDQLPPVALVSNLKDSDVLYERFSSINKLLRFIACCLRLKQLCRFNKRINGELTADEISTAHIKLITLIQLDAFSKEIQNLKSNKPLIKTSKLMSLNPFLDTDGVLRVGGRLEYSKLHFSQKHPILLPRNHHVTILIIRETHLKAWHAGVQGTLNLVRQKYWPIDGKNTTRQILHKCIRCFKMKPKVPDYLMGNLPDTRVTMTRPFSNVGVDYCGPFYIKEKKHRNTQKIKSYIVIFVCFATKAVHIELTTDLTSESCLAAIRRFFGRRGRASNLYSDNGTNFVGAKNELTAIRSLLHSSNYNNTISHSLANDGVNWHFIPPRSPHFGGLWEIAVRAFKHHFYRTVGNTLFTYEQFNTCIIEIEAILNSRPLTPISSDPNDLTSLCPSHFLIGDIMMGLPEANIEATAINRLSTFNHIQQIKQHFWRRWHKEYLNECHIRSKWQTGDAEKIKLGTMVMIKEDNISPMHWLLGRVVEFIRAKIKLFE